MNERFVAPKASCNGLPCAEETDHKSPPQFTRENIITLIFVGPPGCGKTELSELTVSELKKSGIPSVVLKENVKQWQEIPPLTVKSGCPATPINYLSNYYKGIKGPGPNKNCIGLQTVITSSSWNEVTKCVNKAEKTTGDAPFTFIVSDGTPSGSNAFVAKNHKEGHLSESEATALVFANNLLVDYLKEKTIVYFVKIHASPGDVVKNINHRGRPEELGVVKEEYITSIRDIMFEQLAQREPVGNIKGISNSRTGNGIDYKEILLRQIRGILQEIVADNFGTKGGPIPSPLS